MTAAKISEQERVMGRAGRAGIASVVTRERTHASLSCYFTVPSSLAVVPWSKPDFCVVGCPGNYSRAMRAFVDGAKHLVASGCSLPCQVFGFFCFVLFVWS